MINVSRNFAEIRDDLRTIRDARREARANATPEDRRRRRILGAAAGALMVGGSYLMIRYDFPPVAVANLRTMRRTKEDRIGTVKFLKDTVGNVFLRTRARLARPAIEHNRPNNRKCVAALAATALMTSNIYPVTRAAEWPDQSPAPAASSPVYAEVQWGLMSDGTTPDRVDGAIDSTAENRPCSFAD